MKQHLDEYLLSPLTLFIAAVLLIILMLIVLLFSPFGIKLIASTADSTLKELTINGISGSLLTGLHIDEIVWDDGDSISLKNVDIKIQKFNLRKGRLIADNVKAENLTININTPSTDITSLPNFGLPLNMNAHLVHLNSLMITENIPDEPESRTLLFQIKDIKLKKVTISDNALRFRRLEGSPIIIDHPIEINVTEGRLNMNKPHEIKTSGSISYMHPELGISKGEIQVAGTLTNYLFDGKLNHQQKKLGKQVVIFNGQGNYKRVHIEKIALNSPYGKVNAKGLIHWKPEINWSFLVNAQQLKTRKYLPEWPATINTEIRLAGSYIDKRVTHNATIVSLEGKLRKHNINLKGFIKEREGVITTEDLNVTLGDNQLHLSGRATEPFDLKWEVLANQINQVIPTDYKHLGIKGNIDGTGILKGYFDKPEIKINLSANKLSYKTLSQGDEAITIKGKVSIEENKAIINKLLLKSGTNTVEVSGVASKPFDLKLDINAPNIKEISPQIGGIISGIGRIKGTVENPNISAHLSAKKLVYKTKTNNYKQGKKELLLETSIGYRNGIIQLKKLTSEIGKNKLFASGELSTPLSIKYSIKANDLSQISSDIAGQVTGDGDLSGSPTSPLIKTQLVASNLTYQNFSLKQSRLQLNTEIKLVDGIPHVNKLSVNIGNNKLEFSGRAISPFDLNWKINANDLNKIMPELSGNIFAQGKFQGNINAPILNAVINSKRMQYKNTVFNTINFNAKTNNGIYSIIGDIKKLKTNDQQINNTHLTIDGRIDDHLLKFTANHNDAKILLTSKGSWLKQRWNGIIHQLSYDDPQAGNWKLQQATTANLSANNVSSGRFCLVGLKTSACSNTASWSKAGGVTLKGTLNMTPLSLFKPWLPTNLSLDGAVTGNYNLKQFNGKPKGSVKIKLPASSFTIMNSDNEKQTYKYKNSEITATVEDKNIKIKAQVEIINRGRFSSSAQIYLSPVDGKDSIYGGIEFDSPNINWAQKYLPRSRGLRGHLTSKLLISGLLKKPKIVGSVALKKGYLRLPEAGTELTNIDINLNTISTEKALIQGKMNMGKGTLIIDGNLNTKDINKWKALVKIKGKNILFMNTNEVRALMSPNLTFGISNKSVTIKGGIKIPQATINLKELPEASIDEAADAIIISKANAKNQEPIFKVKPDINVELSDNVKLSAFGLKANISGKVRVFHNQNDILANGSLKVTKGKYKAYGQNLKIDNGRLIFNGPPTIVGMNIRATRSIDESIVGIHLGGTLARPKSKIFSNPTLPESEALSFLISGHSLSTSSGQESALLMSAVRGLGITGSNSLIHKIGSSFGLDDVNVVTNEDFKKSELSLGKRLGSRLYVRYLVGLFDQTKKIAIEYKINNVLSLEAQSSTKNSGLDFIYEIERD